jgi:RNA-binding protein YlmH
MNSQAVQKTQIARFHNWVFGVCGGVGQLLTDWLEARAIKSDKTSQGKVEVGRYFLCQFQEAHDKRVIFAAVKCSFVERWMWLVQST